MRVLSVRDFEGIKPTLLDPNCQGISPVYQVYNELNDPHWTNRTEIYAGRLGTEFPKTFGHYHSVANPETYRVVSGTGVMILQKKHVESGVTRLEQVDEVLLVRAVAGDEVVILPEWGHNWANVNQETLVLLDDWKTGHSPDDYEIEAFLHGMAYYLVDEGGQVKEKANSNYKNLPPAKWITASEYNKQYGTPPKI